VKKGYGTMRLPLLIFHVSAGVLAMFAGGAAMSFRKGSRWHGRAGNVFVAAMLLMAVSASSLAYMKHQSNNFFGGILTIYMVATAWATARRRSGETGILDWLGFLFALVFAVLSVVQGFQKFTGRIPADPGTYPFMQLFIGSVILLAAVGDLRMLLRGISGRRRVARHLWRMCFGWFFATGSFFLGQQQVFPAWLRGSPILMVPALLPLVLLIFWLIRVRFTNVSKRMPMPRGGEVFPIST
jgi:uncharacterized membrane protein